MEEKDQFDLVESDEEIELKKNSSITPAPTGFFDNGSATPVRFEDLEKVDKHNQFLISKLPEAEPFFEKTFTIKIYLSQIKPRIWRTLKVPGSITLNALVDHALLPAMGWCRNLHSYIFYGTN
jgi:hypothetical protein